MSRLSQVYPNVANLLQKRARVRSRRGRDCAQPRSGRSVLERYVAGVACPACPERSLGEPVEGTPEDARKDGHICGRSRAKA